MQICMLVSLLMTSIVFGCKEDVMFVVDESELMRGLPNQRTGFLRVNGQITEYLQKLAASSSPGISRAGYITIGMDDAGTYRQAAKRVSVLTSDFNGLISNINQISMQNYGLSWTQVAMSLPSLVTKGSKVVIITALEPSYSNGTFLSDKLKKLGADVHVIGLPFKKILNLGGLQALASDSSKVKILTDFDNNVIRSQLQKWFPTTCTVIDEDCSRCKYGNGNGYINDKKNCHRFYYCEYRVGSEQPIKHSFMCPWYTVWNQTTLTCVHEDKKNTCAYCNPPNEYGKYPVKDNCRMYRECNGTKPYEDRCCEIGQRFDPGSQTCVFDQKCKDKCGDDGTPFECNKYADKDDICKYRLRQPGHPIYIQNCAAGTKFSRELCLCIALLAGESCATDERDLNGCLWTVELPFSDGLKTKGQNGVSSGPVFAQSSYLSNEKVLVSNMAREAVFRDGKGYLQSWYFSYRQWQPNLLVKLNFQEDTTSNGDQVLLTNDCCCTDSLGPSVFIYTNPATGKVTGGVKMAVGGAVSVDLSYDVNQYRGQWKEVTLQKAGGVLKMRLKVTGTSFDQTTQEKAALDDILIRKCTLKLGGPANSGVDSFKGKMSSFFLSNECDVIPSPELI